MLEKLYPGKRKHSVYEITPEYLKERQIRGIIFDVDNTLVPHGAPADEAIRAYFAALHMAGIHTCLLSNNKEYRVRPFAEAVGSIFVFNGRKPSRKGYYQAMQRMGTDKTNTLFVGDQIFTDIWGANRAGLDTVLLDPIDPKEEIQIILKRIPEKLVLFFYELRKK